MRHVSIPLVVLCCVLLLAACGRQLGPICTSMGPGGPGTLSTGDITIATDHSVYDPRDTVQVTITNHLADPMAIVSGAPNCPFLLFERQERNSWTTESCATGNGDTELPANQYPILQRASYKSTIPLVEDPFVSSPGTYRFMTRYEVQFPGGAIGQKGFLYSQTFQVCGCRDCSAS